jgi:quinoprotein glucose dehydrogenase
MVGGSMSDRPQFREQAPGNVQAFDVRSGKPRWTFKVIPRAGEFGNETWENGSSEYTGMVNLWSMISADEAAGLAYLPLWPCGAPPASGSGTTS